VTFGKKGGKNEMMAMVAECPVDCFVETFDGLATHVRTVDFIEFMEKIAGLADSIKFPEATRPHKPANAALCQRGGDWWKANFTWLGGVARVRRSLELKMQNLPKPRVFEAVGTRSKGGWKKCPVEELLVDYHGLRPHGYRHEGGPVVRIKQHLHGLRPTTCFYCSKNYEQLATEAYEAGLIVAPWVELYVQFIQLDHTVGR